MLKMLLTFREERVAVPVLREALQDVHQAGLSHEALSRRPGVAGRMSLPVPFLYLVLHLKLDLPSFIQTHVHWLPSFWNKFVVK